MVRKKLVKFKAFDKDIEEAFDDDMSYAEIAKILRWRCSTVVIKSIEAIKIQDDRKNTRGDIPC